MEGDNRFEYALSVDGIAEYILSGKCKNIVFLTGAGVSVGAGIPDFRSPGGMYDTLKPELLTATDQERAIMKREPTFVVNKQLFKVNQFPYLELRRPFILGLAEAKWKATVTHWFIAICQKKGLLRRLFTQNIDGLDFQTNISNNNIVGVHGTLGKIVCEDCHHECPIEEFRDKVKKISKTYTKWTPPHPKYPPQSTVLTAENPKLNPTPFYTALNYRLDSLNALNSIFPIMSIS